LGTASFSVRKAGCPSCLLGLVFSGCLWVVTASVFSFSVVLGGGTLRGLWSDATVQLLSLLLIVTLMPRLLQNRDTGAGLGPLLIVAALVILPLLQLLPMPPNLWMLLPGRETIAVVYQETGTTLPWLPISLDPTATWRGALSLLPAIAVFFATLRLTAKARRSISLLLIVLGVVSVLLGLAQLMQGPSSSLRFYPITNPHNSVGFFANRNHFAALLYCLIPFTAAWVIGLVFDRRRERLLGLAVCLLVYVALLLGLGMALSRAGFFLAIVAALASLLLAVRHERRIAKYGIAILGGAILLGAILFIQFAFFDLLVRFDDGVLSDYRFRIAEGTIEAGRVFQPIGSGFGTFVPIYQMFEASGALLTSYVNHAHNDWLQVWLEGGWLAIAATVGFLIWFAQAGARVWRAPQTQSVVLDRALAQAASITIGLLLIHSAMDYPLRTTAIMVVFAYCCALLIPPVPMPHHSPSPINEPTGNTSRHRIREKRFRVPVFARRAGRSR
jgi:O-antigen ligase